jgi:hypothetical protein
MEMNKKQKIEKCREILYKYRINCIIENDEDIQFLLSIFENHPEWASKQGVGIKSISTVFTQYYNNRCFQLNRIDGSFTDISFTKIISKPSDRSEVKKACRTAVKECVIKYRNENVIYGKSICPITGEILTKENTHIDHYDLTFDLMFENWIKKYDINFLLSKINETTDNSVITCFTDKSIIDDFISYHNENSKLRAVTKNANLSILNHRIKIDSE